MEGRAGAVKTHPEQPPPYAYAVGNPVSVFQDPICGGYADQPPGYSTPYNYDYGGTQFQPSAPIAPPAPTHAPMRRNSRYQELEPYGVDLGAPTLQEPTGLDRFCNACTWHVNCCAPESSREDSWVVLATVRKEGWWMFWSLILPSISIEGAPLWQKWMHFQIASAIALTILSGVSFGGLLHTRHQYTWNLVHLIVCGIWAGLSCFDGILMCNQSSTKAKQMYLMLFRLMYSAVCLYIAIVSDLFDLVIYGAHKHLTFAHVFLTLTFFVVFVSLKGFVIITYLLHSTHLLYEADRSNAMCRLGISYFRGFLAHFVGQSIIQVLMIITLGVRIDEAKYSVDSVPEREEMVGFHINSFMWTLFVLGLVIPATGTLMYFVTSMYWLQEYLIGVCTAVLSVRSGPDVELVGRNRVSWLNMNLSFSEKEHVRQLRRLISLETLYREAIPFCNKPTLLKIFFPSQSPTLALLCMLYSLLLIAFPVLVLYHTPYIMEEQPDSAKWGYATVIPLSHESSWQIFYSISVVVYATVNLYPLAVGPLSIGVFAVALVIFIFTLLFHHSRHGCCNGLCTGSYSCLDTARPVTNIPLPACCRHTNSHYV